MLSPLLEILPPVCTKSRAWDVANIAWSEAKWYIWQEILTKSHILSYKQSGSALSLYTIHGQVLIKYTSLKFNAFSTQIYTNGLLW